MKQRSVLMRLPLALILMSATVLPLAVLTGAGTASASGKTKVYMIPKFTGIAPFTDAAAGCKKEGAKLGLICLYGGPTTGSATDQVSFINNAVSAARLPSRRCT